MNEGWFGDDYLVLFSAEESRIATQQYQAAKLLPGHTVIGLRGWDDLIVRNANGETQVVPTVPLSAQHASPFAFPEQPSLERDARFVGKIKWYINPLVFGGDASAKENTTWVTHEQHRQLVAWWNAKYQEVKGKGAGA